MKEDIEETTKSNPHGVKRKLSLAESSNDSDSDYDVEDSIDPQVKAGVKGKKDGFDVVPQDSGNIPNVYLS